MSTDSAEKPSSLQGEYGNIALLLLLYILQAVPMGLFGFVNMEVKEIFKDSFSEQGTFMLAAWPFSLKLLWAPLVDSVYVNKVGRRKSWMVPAQIAIGLVLLYLSPRIEGLFADKDVNTLTLTFFFLYFLCATQDIAVDGWALTMLRPENAGWASTCNAVGQTVGFTVGFMIPMAKMFSLPNFIAFWGVTFLVTTAAVWMLKHEAEIAEDEEIESLKEAYTQMYQVLRLRPVQLLALHLITRSLAFIPADVMASGRLQDAGFKKEDLAGIKLFITPLEIALPWLLSRFTVGPKPLTVIIVTYIPRTLLTVLTALFAFGVGTNIASPTPTGVYMGVFAITILQGIVSNAMFVAHMAFFAKVSDPAIGGTYMTFLNTVHNIGNMWASTFCLKAADYVRDYTGMDGFYVLSGACTAYGFIWFLFCRPMLERLQTMQTSEWRIDGTDKGKKS
eukprot:TRINITY_DN7144_c0_g3_i1.p1 TRINITY_DN7144_c0_g3~~TRINITY_DN7144_c0_g3_i1.p1  ORF type:complete len:448 (+),score=73.96 TRINITY_DN7144_c0_g3_i1:97-1440(+)